MSCISSEILIAGSTNTLWGLVQGRKTPHRIRDLAGLTWGLQRILVLLGIWREDMDQVLKEMRAKVLLK